MALVLDWEQNCWQLGENIRVGHQKPQVTEVALDEVLGRLVNEHDPHLTGCPTDRVHLTPTCAESSIGRWVLQFKLGWGLVELIGSFLTNRG